MARWIAAGLLCAALAGCGGPSYTDLDTHYKNELADYNRLDETRRQYYQQMLENISNDERAAHYKNLVKDYSEMAEEAANRVAKAKRARDAKSP